MPWTDPWFLLGVAGFVMIGVALLMLALCAAAGEADRRVVEMAREQDRALPRDWYGR
jgi:hypothetical protein